MNGGSPMEVVLNVETPLDVLSRAACMLESVDQSDRSPTAVKRSASDREPSTRVSTHSTTAHRHKVPIDDDECVPSDNISSFKCRRLDQETMRHSADTSRKCAGTQTSFSSFVYTPNESAPCAHVTAAPPASSRSDPAHHDKSVDNPRTNFDIDPTNNVPLNLTVSSSGRNSGSNSPTEPTRRSPELSRSIWKPLDPVGQRMSVSSGSMDGSGSWGSRSLSSLGRVELRRPESSPCLRPTEQQQRKSVSVVTFECDDDIEAHFQRSLGRDYSRHLANQHHNNSLQSSADATLANAAVTSYLNGDRLECRNADVSVSVSVDDHFTKSLGPMWNQIKSGLADSVQTDAAGNDSNHFTNTIGSNGAEIKLVSPPIPGSVDDHFAKALGDAWFKIKAEQEKV